MTLAWRLGFTLLTVAAALARLAAIGSAAAAPMLALPPCHIKGLAEEVQCGGYEVFEDRRAGSGRRIPIHSRPNGTTPARDERTDMVFNGALDAAVRGILQT